MKSTEKEKYVKELRDIIARINIDTLNKNPKDELVHQGFYRTKAILLHFDHGLGKRMGELMASLQNPLRSQKEIDALGLRNWLIEKTEEMDIYSIEDPVQDRSEKIKKVLKGENLKVQSNIEGEDEHLMIFDKNSTSGGHVHLIVDGGTGEVRIDPKDVSPHELLSKVETILTTKAGQKIRATRNTLEFLDDNVDFNSVPILDLIAPLGRSGGPQGHFNVFKVKNLDSKNTAIDCKFFIRGFGYEWGAKFTDPVTLEPMQTKDITYKISDEPTFNTPIKELKFIMEFKDLFNNSYQTRRDLFQEKVKSDAFYDIHIGQFHKVTKSVEDNLRLLSAINRNGDAYEMLFEIEVDKQLTRISIGISGSLAACWGLNDEKDLRHTIIELARRKIMKLIKDKQPLSSYMFLTTDFPSEYTNGWDGYVKARDSI